MMSAVKKVDYGRYRKEDMRQTSAEHIGKVYNGYASVTREFRFRCCARMRAKCASP
jgi:hypothetical protein